MSQLLWASEGTARVTRKDISGSTCLPGFSIACHMLKRYPRRKANPVHRISSGLLLLFTVFASPVAPSPSVTLETSPTPPSSPTLLEASIPFISKCCPPGSILTAAGEGRSFSCVPRSPLHEVPEPESALNETTMAEEEEEEEGFPEWLDPLMPVVDSAGKEVTSREFLEANPHLQLRLGFHPQCADIEIVKAKYHNRFRLHANGSLSLRLSQMGGAGEVLLSSADFCVDRAQGSSSRQPVVLLACPCRRVTCVRKCCADPHVLHFKLTRNLEIRCAPPSATSAAGVPSRPWRPVFHNEEDLKPLESVETPTYHLLRASKPLCPALGHDMVVLNYGVADDAGNISVNRMWVTRNGSAHVEGFQDVHWLDNSRWCGDSSTPAEGQEDERFTHAHNALICAPHVSTANPDARPSSANVAYSALFLIGAVFLSLTLAVYIILPEFRALRHAKALCCHCFALLISTVALAVAKLTPHLNEGSCIALPLVIQFFILSSFFWLNVLCIDISWTFSGLRGLLGSLLNASRKKFVYYSLYAWGCPLIITSVTAILQEASDANRLPRGILSPGFGRVTCWFYGTAATWAFLYGPMLVLLLVNAALFAFTAIKLVLANRDGAELNRGDSVRHDRSSRLSTEKRRLILHLKLFLLMGVTWLMEVISWAVIPQRDDQDPSALWYATDAINMLRGVFIFFIFCCKRTVVRLMRKRMEAWGWRCSCLQHVGEVQRSTTHRSGLSTRTSSLLPLGALQAIGEAAKGDTHAAVEGNGDTVTGDAASRKASLVSVAAS